jgi:hypothetical protein
MGASDSSFEIGDRSGDPRNIDSAVLLDLADKYGGEAFTAALKRQGGQFSRSASILRPEHLPRPLSGGVAAAD